MTSSSEPTTTKNLHKTTHRRQRLRHYYLSHRDYHVRKTTDLNYQVPVTTDRHRPYNRNYNETRIRSTDYLIHRDYKYPRTGTTKMPNNDRHEFRSTDYLNLQNYKYLEIGTTQMPEDNRAQKLQQLRGKDYLTTKAATEQLELTTRRGQPRNDQLPNGRRRRGTLTTNTNPGQVLQEYRDVHYKRKANRGQLRELKTTTNNA